MHVNGVYFNRSLSIKPLSYSWLHDITLVMKPSSRTMNFRKNYQALSLEYLNKKLPSKPYTYTYRYYPQRILFWVLLWLTEYFSLCILASFTTLKTDKPAAAKLCRKMTQEKRTQSQIIIHIKLIQRYVDVDVCPDVKGFELFYHDTPLWMFVPCLG